VLLAAASTGNNKPANTAMIAITTNSSIKVKEAPDPGSPQKATKSGIP
jgi:hypothetical protein